MPSRPPPPTDSSSPSTNGRMWKTKLQVFPQKTPSTSNISDNRLRLAADRFYEFRGNLKTLRVVLQKHLKDLETTAASRASVVEALTAVSRSTGSPLPEESFAVLYTDADPDQKSVQLSLKQYKNEIVAYVSNWETTVSTRVATELKHIQNLHKTWEKYQYKVDTLKTKADAAAQKKRRSKQAKADQILEQISWNESKLRTARKEYRRNLIAVTLFTEEVTDRGWKDLIPLMIRLIDYDVTTMRSAADLVKRLATTREEIIQLADQYEMDFQTIRTGRLTVLREEDAGDFADPGDLQDVESTTQGKLENASHGSPGSPASPISPVGENSKESKESKGTIASSEVYLPTLATKDLIVDSGKKEQPKDDPASDTGNEIPKGEDPSEEKEEKMNAPVANAGKGAPEDDPAADRKYLDSSECGVPNYPSSIYLLCDPAVPGYLNDDETTLTGVPDLASI